MAKKEKKAPEGAPEWMVTYGDMMTLLLCFFVMIVAMSEIKKDEKFMKVVESIQQRFGYDSGIGIAPTDQPPEMAPTHREQSTADENKDLTKGLASEDAQVGDHELVTYVYPGQRFTIGGVAAFRPGRAELLPEAYDPLLKIAAKVRGLQYRLDIRGHTSAAPLPAGSSYRDHMELSVARAAAVRAWMIGKAEDRGRIDARRVRVVGAGKYEPLKARAYEPSEWAANDRVDIVMDEALTPEFEASPSEKNLLSQLTDTSPGESYAAGE